MCSSDLLTHPLESRVKLLVTLSENEKLEYKLDYSPQALKTVSAFANYSGGKIVFGMSDDGKIIGIDDSHKLRLRIENAINDNLTPRPDYKLETLELEEVTIVELTVSPGSDPPYFYKGKAYKRSDTATTPVDPSELRNLIKENLDNPYDQMTVTEDDLSFKLLEEELRHSKGISQLSEDTLRTLNLIRDGKFTRAAEWLADRNNNLRCATHIVRFGRDISTFRDRRDFDSVSLIMQYKGALEMYEKWYGTYEEIEGFRRVARVLVPREAYREAVLNALIHRRLDMNSAVQIAMYDDRIEITSPGGLPPGISKADYLFGQVSNPRNPTLSLVFFTLNYIERFGTGIRRIRQAYQDFAEEAAFDISDHFIRLTLPVIDLNKPKQGEDLASHILRLLKEHGHLSRADLETMTGYGKSSVQNALNTLIDQAFIQRTGAARSTRYQLL